MLEVKILKSVKRSEDGYSIQSFKEGDTCKMSRHLANRLGTKCVVETDASIINGWNELKAMKQVERDMVKQWMMENYVITRPHLIEQFAEFCEGL